MDNFAPTTGFHYLRPESLVEEGLIVRSDSPVSASSRGDINMFDGTSRREDKLRRLSRYARNAYINDGFVNHAINKHAELFKDFELIGEDDAVSYLNKRLTMSSIQMGEYWKQTIRDSILELFISGTSFLGKIRGSSDLAYRPVYAARSSPIVGLSLIGSDRVDPNRNNGRFLGWKLNDHKHRDNNGLTLSGATRLPIDEALIAGAYSQDEGNMCKGADLIVLADKRGADCEYGQGLTFSGLEDVAILRGLETTTAISAKKNAHPLIQHRVMRATNPMGGIQPDLDYAAYLHRSMSPDGVIVTPGTHEIEVHGMESQALRQEPTLKYFASRAFTGLGVSGFLMGFEPGTLGTSEAATELLMTKIRSVGTVISQTFEQYLFNEILWEGGFDPYFKEEDRVQLRFKYFDEDRTIKMQNHFVDVWVKGGIDFDEMRQNCEFFGPVQKSLLYLNMVQIPLERAKASAQIPLEHAKAEAKAANPVPVKKPKKKVKEMVLSLLPLSKEHVEDFALMMERLHGLSVWHLVPRLSLLAGDEAAMLEVLYEEFADGSNE